MIITISVRYYGGAYIANARGTGKTCSSTSSAKFAAEGAAKKVFGATPFTLKQVTGATFTATETETK